MTDNDIEKFISDFETLSSKVYSPGGSIGGYQISADAWRELRAHLRRQPDPTTWRCAMYAQDPFTTRLPRSDGWRCGYESNAPHNHTLYSADGESILNSGSWASTPRAREDDE